MRIAISSSSFGRPLRVGELTQLEWVERCAAVLAVDGIVAALEDFPRTDAEYVAQLRKVAIDLGIVPFGLDAPRLLDPTNPAGERDAAIAVATGFGAAIIRTVLPPPGAVPPASFVEAVATAKLASRAAKAANVTLVVTPAPGTLGHDLDAVKHLLRDVDSAWLRACPPALADRSEFGPRDRCPAFAAAVGDDPAGVAAACGRSWVIADAPDAHDPWEELGAFIRASRDAEAAQRCGRVSDEDRNGRLGSG